MATTWRFVRVLAGGLTLVCGMLPAQSRRIEDLAAGRLLVMDPQAADPVFAESVILMIHYSAEEVMGLRLNQPSRAPLSRLREVKGTGNRSDPAYIGGPVGIEGVTALVRTPSAPRDSLHVTEDLYALQTKNSLEAALKTSKGPEDLRVYLGYCGWTVPQLKNEVSRGGWYIFDHGERFAFDSAPATLWKRLIELTNVRLALILTPKFEPGNPLSRDREALAGLFAVLDPGGPVFKKGANLGLGCGIDTGCGVGGACVVFRADAH